MISVEQANVIVAKLRELETQQNLMKDLFNRALRTSQSGSDVKWNFRQAERHMPGMFNGKATEYIGYPPGHNLLFQNKFFADYIS